jgi:signal transduction histidine kinase
VTGAQIRRPISRRLMLALFVVMIVPVCGWYFIGDLSSRLVAAGFPEAAALEFTREIRFELAITLGISVIVLGSVVVYVRRTVLDPMERLAEQARQSWEAPWAAPPEIESPDEIGDLARALDRSITRLHRRAEQAEQLASNLSHELRTPLAAIRGAGEILVEPDIDEADRVRFATHVVAESIRLERLVAGLLDLARAQKGSAATQEPSLVRSLVEQAVDRCSSLLEERNLSVSGTDDDAVVRAGGDSVARVLTILLENACQHAPPDGTIVVSWAMRAGDAEIAVEDDGPGIPSGMEERIFERWYSSGTEGQKGVGLGLAIAVSLVENLGGNIKAGRSSLGGARFVFSLPA